MNSFFDNLAEIELKQTSHGNLWDYMEVIKPRETGVLVFIGMVTALLAGNGSIPTGKSFLVLATLVTACAGANGLTNYLDRGIDARMERTRQRALPSGRLYPPEKALYLSASLSFAGLALAWFLHPYAFLAGLLGTAAAVVYRKRATCVFPQGLIASCAPVLIAWFAIRSTVDWQLPVLCIFIAIWLPSHVWSIMLARRGDYLQAGITYFPVSRGARPVTRILFACCCLLYAASTGLYFTGSLGWLYLAAANLLGILVVFAGLRLALSPASQNAWQMYKMSAFPYLGLLFLAIGLDMWL